jgi:hypothetical protein
MATSGVPGLAPFACGLTIPTSVRGEKHQSFEVNVDFRQGKVARKGRDRG